MSTLRDKMSCTVMYQPYAMSAYSTCDRPPPEKKSFRFPYVPSPPDSLHSDGSSYSSPGPSSGGTTASSSAPSSASTNNNNNNIPSGGARRPLTPCHPPGGGGGGGHLVPGGGLITPSPGGASSAPATITSSQHLQQQQQQQQQQQRSPPSHLLSHAPRSHAHLPLGASSTASSTSTSHTQVHEDEEDSSQEGNNLHMSSLHQLPPGGGGGGGGAPSSSMGSMSSSSAASSSRAQYLSANCVVYEHYRGDAARVVEEHFTRALSSSYANEKGSKNEPMTARNFPPSFWNSNYQPAKPLMSYGPSDFYGGSVDYGSPLTGLSHHSQGDPWHYPLSSHQGYHHRPSELPYPPMPSSSRFNAAQYGSFLLAGAAASSSGRGFHGMGASGGCGVKGEAGGGWSSGRYVHPHHDSISDLHLDYNYSAAAAAAYSNMTAGLETTVGQESSKGDAAYWF